MAGKFTQFGERTGHLDFLDWDKAVVEAMDCQYDPAENQWYFPLQPLYFEEPEHGPVAIDKAVAVYKRPEPTQIEWDLPLLAFINDDIAPDAGRLLGEGTVGYRLPAEGATPVSIQGMIGYNLYETKGQERPYDLVYTVEAWSRYRSVSKMLLGEILRRFPIRGNLTLVDGNGIERTYLVTQEAVADLTEVASMVDRVCGYAVTIRIEAEVTLDQEPVCVPAFTGPTTTDPGDLGPGGPGPGDGGGNPDYPDGNPNLPGGGLYGLGVADIRVTYLED